MYSSSNPLMPRQELSARAVALPPCIKKYLTRKPPLAFAAHSFLEIPPAKNQHGEE